MHPKPEDRQLKECCYFAKCWLLYECKRKHEGTEKGSGIPCLGVFCSLETKAVPSFH